jgi:hypothetical protein
MQKAKIALSVAGGFIAGFVFQHELRAHGIGYIAFDLGLLICGVYLIGVMEPIKKTTPIDPTPRRLISDVNASYPCGCAKSPAKGEK